MKIKEAFEILSDPRKRAIYDSRGLDGFSKEADEATENRRKAAKLNQRSHSCVQPRIKKEDTKLYDLLNVSPDASFDQIEKVSPKTIDHRMFLLMIPIF